MYQAFSPIGPTVLIDSIQIRQVDPPGGNAQQPTAYRIRNLSASADAWIAWAPMQPSNVTPAAFTATAPAIGSPQLVLGLGAKQTEVFAGLPMGAWFIASSGATFEVTPGEGL